MKRYAVGTIVIVALLSVWLSMPTAAAEPEVYLYSSMWLSDDLGDGNVVLHGSATVEKTNCGWDLVEVRNDLRDPSFNVLDSSGTIQGYCYQEAYTEAVLVGDASPEGVYKSQAKAWVDSVEYGCVFVEAAASQYDARYRYNRQLAAGDYEYIRATADCNGVCEGPRKCHTVRKEWLKVRGWYMSIGPVASCLGQVIPTDVMPPCNMIFGAVVDNLTGCSGES